MHNITNVREVALHILYKIDNDKAYSNIVLDDEINKSSLDRKDKALLTKLVYGTLTYLITIDEIIKKYSKIKWKKISPWILNILRMGIYQIIYLEKIPKRAIVNEGVNLAKKYGHKASSGFVNAILKTVEPNELEKMTFESDIDKLSILTSHPKWLIEELLKEYDFETVSKICEYNNIEPPIYIRVNTLKVSKEELVNLLGKDDIQTQDVDIPNTLKVLESFDIANSELFKKGYFTIQDAAATLTGIVLGANENENILDLCSAPGGKTTHIAELMNNTGSIIACDIYENRLKLVLATAKRLGAINIKTRQNDATCLNDDYVDKFDRVLADVPCSGIGVIRRKIDIKYQKDIESLSKISDIQYQILENASKYVKKNGVLVYSTCTIFKKEHEDNVEMFLKNNPNFELVDISNMVEKNVADGKYIKTLPHIQNFDGFFIAKMVRKE